MLWIELLTLPLLVPAGQWVGRWATRLPGRWWVVGFLVPLAVVVLVIAGRRSVMLSFVPGISWVVDAGC